MDNERHVLDKIEINIPNDNMLRCREWAYHYELDERFPDKKQFESLQKLGYLPKERKTPNGDSTFKLNYGHYGWHIDYNWTKISKKVLADSPLLTMAEMEEFYWNCLIHMPVKNNSFVKVFTIGNMDNNAIRKIILALKMVIENEYYSEPKQEA